MNTLKKKRLAGRIICIALLISMLASCGSGKSTASKVSSSAASSKRTASSTKSEPTAVSDSSGEMPLDESSVGSHTSSQESKADNNSSSETHSNVPESDPFASIAHYEVPTPTESENYKKYGHNGNTPTGQYILNGERDAWKWPYARNSIWNTPIGSNAKYKPANLKSSYMYLLDDEYILKTKSSDPVVSIYNTSMNNRWPSNYKTSLRKSNLTTYWPKGYIISKNEQGNTCSAILQPDGRTLIQLQPTCHDEANADYITGYNRDVSDIYGDGRLGTHWGSGLSTLGGSIRLGELTGSEPIRHALKIDLYGKKWIYYSSKVPGFKWPADRCDGGASSGNYGGTDPNIIQGTLFALSPELTAEGLGLKTDVGKKLFFTMQNYGCYLVDDSAFDSHNLCAEVGVDKEVKAKYGHSITGKSTAIYNSKDQKYHDDFMTLITHLSIVTNNYKNSVGGGGTPRQPLAPNLNPVN